MDPIRVVLADDEEGMRQVMRKILQRSGGFEISGEARDGVELVELVEKHRPHLALLDVEMPRMTGVEAARIIQDTDPATILIFSTAHDHYMADAFSVYAFDYLLKPFKVDRALQTLEKVKQVIRLRRDDRDSGPPVPAATQRAPAGRLMLKHREGVTILSMDDILLVQRENRATALYTADGGRYVTGDTLGDVETRLDPQVFFRCHKSYIVNLSHIDSIAPYGRWTYIIRLRGTKHDALITHEKYEELERIFR